MVARRIYVPNSCKLSSTQFGVTKNGIAEPESLDGHLHPHGAFVYSSANSHKFGR
ncbi:hypothetical protein B0H19DRAFT_1095113 [Mycena capillaripes]|nr:hypothetical protein B0H19DRAFT_1201307 [Mycena capillaripes]KAJ6588612.1 hypothetical protein B0H19DRAFT_1100272 [Mycena capillaripes]KAJ6594346.1 hypothetical protein B0H19DRAFT_1095113 [Mycena capillaripes]